MTDFKKTIARKILPWCIRTLYSRECKGEREEFKRKVNNETWLGSMIGSGGCSLNKSKPICDEEVISIMCVLSDNCSYGGDDSKAEPVDYFESNWKY